MTEESFLFRNAKNALLKSECIVAIVEEGAIIFRSLSGKTFTNWVEVGFFKDAATAHVVCQILNETQPDA